MEKDLKKNRGSYKTEDDQCYDGWRVIGEDIKGSRGCSDTAIV